MKVIHFSKTAWVEYSEQAHSIVFGKIKPKEWDRIDYALMAVNDKVPMGYITCREHDALSVYWQFGGVFPGTKDTTASYRVLQAFICWAKERYKRVTMLIENKNLVMLKMAMKAGFRISGIRYFNESVLLEHLLEFQEV